MSCGAGCVFDRGGAVAKEQDKKKGESIAITNVRIFDGDRMIPDGTVIITGQTITYVGKNATKIPDGAQVIDGTGKTLMPGMIDGHAHDWGWGVERALVFGVTTELEMFGDGPIAQYIRDQEAVDGAPQWASLVTAGTLATAPGGHGTQYRPADPDPDAALRCTAVGGRPAGRRLGFHQARPRGRLAVRFPNSRGRHWIARRWRR